MKMDNMIKKTLHIFTYILIFNFIVSQPMFANEFRVTLVSDKITYTKVSELLIAKGNVKVTYGNTTLSASEIRYDSNIEELSIIGKFVLSDDKNIITSENDTLINIKLKNALIKSARTIIDNKLQLSAQTLILTDTNYNIFNTVVASSCKICANNPTPFWKIRARKVIHDKEKQKLYFKNAKLDFLGLPILYIPNLKVPEPGISRASGVLVPQFSTSNRVGFSTKIPYYVALNSNKDFTITPFFMSRNSFILETEYRQQTENGYFEFVNAFSIKNHLNSNAFNGFINGKGTFKLKSDYLLNFKIDVANKINFKKGEKSFKTNFGYTEPENDRLKNNLEISKTTKNSFFQLGASFTQSFIYKDFNGNGLKEKDPNIPLIFPEILFEKNYNAKILGGVYTITGQSVTLLNDKIGQYSRIGGNIEWQNNWITPTGFSIGALSKLNTNFYFSENKFYKNAMPTSMLKISYPIKKNNNFQKSQMLEPIIQIITAPNKHRGDLNDDKNTLDSTTAEFEDTSLFSINRFPGYDTVEVGNRINLGARYILHGLSGNELKATLGKVFRYKNLNQFNSSISTGLDTKNSDYVSSFSLKTNKGMSISSKLLFDNSFNISKNETKFSINNIKYKLEFNYVWLEKQSILNLENQQHEFNVKTEYNLNQNWKFNASWRQNLNIKSPLKGGFDLIYENECSKVNFSLDLQFDEHNNIEKTFGLQVFLSGINSTEKSKIRNQCAG